MPYSIMLRVPYLSSVRDLRDVFTTTCYTNPHLPLPLLEMSLLTEHTVNCLLGRWPSYHLQNVVIGHQWLLIIMLWNVFFCCSSGFLSRNQKLWIHVQSTKAKSRLQDVCTSLKHRWSAAILLIYC